MNSTMMFCRLEKLVLGDGSNILDNIVTVEHVLGNDQLLPNADSGIDIPYNSDENIPQARKPAWEDADDNIVYVYIYSIIGNLITCLV